jgi:hypothetical protein
MTSNTSVESSSPSSPAEAVLVQADPKGRLRVSKEQRKAVLAQFEQSGMSGAKFAAVAGIKNQILHFRRVELFSVAEASAPSAQPQKSVPVDFSDLQLSNAPRW